MEDKHTITLSAVPKEELDAEHGRKGVQVGKAYKTLDHHFYLQREDDVLHLNIDIENGDYVINNLHIAHIKAYSNELEEITKAEFDSALKQTKNILNI